MKPYTTEMKEGELQRQGKAMRETYEVAVIADGWRAQGPVKRY